MFIEYIILAIISAGTLVWACRHVPGGDEPPARDDGDGGLPVGGDSSPSTSPPSFVINPNERCEDDEPAPGVHA